MLKVRFSPTKPTYDMKCALQYSEKDFDELSKVWAAMGLELLVHKQDKDPMIDIIDRDTSGYICCAETISKGGWFVYDIDRAFWSVLDDSDFTSLYKIVNEEVQDGSIDLPR